ncbi:hypothetical protein GCM10010277_84890 [Streptomyces longisporoflavus]|nr:hypothetical protein GCM10010277_84890 [Streptomyces longisporoflavus]
MTTQHPRAHFDWKSKRVRHSPPWGCAAHSRPQGGGTRGDAHKENPEDSSLRNAGGSAKRQKEKHSTDFA